MSLKLSRNKVNHLTRLIVNHIENSEEVDYQGEIGNMRMKVFHLIMDELRLFRDIEERATERVGTQKKTIPEGSREWEILYRKYCSEELDKMGKIWD
jgi:uncharacterized protein